MSTSMYRITKVAAVGVVACVLAFTLSTVTVAAEGCALSLRQGTSLGPTYVTSLEVFSTSCANGIKVTRAFHSCRLKKGRKGRCTKKVRGYSCTEKRPASESDPGQYEGVVTCRRKSARITHEYSQNF